MKIKDLFVLYEDFFAKYPTSKKSFSESGMVNNFAKLDFGFFPLGSGILSANSTIDTAEITDCKIMVLGNDFGTINYVENDCPNNQEKKTNPTIRNLFKLELNKDTTFFTNLYLGLRKEGKNIDPKTVKAEYKSLSFAFFKIQLDFINPEIVLCLGKEVRESLSEISTIFSNPAQEEKSIITNDDFFGKRKFIFIPHPSMAHFNWKGEVINEIKASLF